MLDCLDILYVSLITSYQIINAFNQTVASKTPAHILKSFRMRNPTTGLYLVQGPEQCIFFFLAFTRITCILFTKIGKQAHLGRGYTGVTSNRILKSTTPLNLMGVTLCCRIWVVEPGGRLPADLLHNSRVSSVIRS